MNRLGVVLLVAACGGGGSTNKDAAVAIDSPHASVDSLVSDGPVADGAFADALVDGAPVDGAVDGAMIDATPTDSTVVIDGSTNPTLKVKNYFSWCSVTVNGGTASTLAEQDVVVAPGTIPVSAVALAPMFILGAAPWHDTVGDTGAGDPGVVTGSGATASSAAMVLVGPTGKCAWICCPFANGTGCPTTDQCP